MRIVRAHIDESILVSGQPDHVDPDKWRPLIMSFSQFYGLGERAGLSMLAAIPEEAYRPVPHMQRKRPSNAPVMDGMVVMDSVHERRVWSVGCSSWPCGD
jgi:hypothetical protein